MDKSLDDVILQFFRDDVMNILITDDAGNVVYEDDKAGQIYRADTNWKIACPLPRAEQKGEVWDLLRRDNRADRQLVDDFLELDLVYLRYQLCLRDAVRV